MLLGVLLQQLARGPFDRKKMKTSLRLAYLDRTNDAGVLDTGTVLSLTNKPRNSGFVVAQLFPKDLESNSAVARMLSLVDLCRAALANLTLNCVSGYL